MARTRLLILSVFACVPGESNRHHLLSPSLGNSTLSLAALASPDGHGIVTADPQFHKSATLPSLPSRAAPVTRGDLTPKHGGSHGSGVKTSGHGGHGAEASNVQAHDGHGGDHGDSDHGGGHGHGHGGHGGHGGMSHHEHKIWLAKSTVAPVTFTFMLVLALISIMEYTHLSWLPEAAVIIAVGMVLGLVLKEVMPPPIQEAIFGSLNSTLLNLFLLPPLIFETGWSVRRRDFASQFGYILLFAIIGVVLSTVVIGLLITWTGSIGLHPAITMRTAFAYAALISATDPVATLATYSELKVDPVLYTMVFGESCLNDGVAIVLFNALNNDAVMDGFSLAGGGALSITREVIVIFIGSVAIGLALGALYILGLRFTGMRRSPRLEILYIMISCYLTFAVTEAFLLSGIISVLFCAFLMGMYARPHLSQEGCLLATFFLKQVATITDCAVFLFVGVSIVRINLVGVEIGLCMAVACVIGRYCAVYPIGMLTNLLKTWHGKSNNQPEEEWHLLTNQHLFMMGHAGLRGAIALVMAMEFGDWVDIDNGDGTRQTLMNVTFFIICAFLLLFGGTTELCLKTLKVRMHDELPPDFLYKSEVDGGFRQVALWTHDKILVPALVGSRRLAAHIEESEVEVDIEDALMKKKRHRKPTPRS